MKKLLFVFPIVALLAAGCNPSRQVDSQTPVPTPVAQNTNPTPTPSPTPTPTPKPTPQATSTTQPSISVTSPNGGSYGIGNQLAINWTSSDYGLNGNKHVDINLLTYDPNSPVRNMVATITSYLSKTGSYSWTIPSSILPGQYIVRVSSSETGEKVWGFSKPFSIASIASAISASKNPAFGDQIVTPSQVNVKIGSFIISAPNTEGIKISIITVDAKTGPFMTTGNFQNLKLMNNGTQLGTTVPFFYSGEGVSFGANLNIATGSSVTIDVYADIRSTAAGSATPATILKDISAVGTTTNYTYYLIPPVVAGTTSTAAPVNGQNVTFSSTTGS